MPTFALQRSVAVLHPKNDVCLPRFLMYALRGKRTYIENRAKGVAQKGIYLKEVSDIDIYIPDISNQKIIINKLEKVNAVIKFRQEELLALDNLIKARFVELFGAYIDVQTHESMKRSSLKHGDILMTKTGRINTENSSLGRAALYMGEDDKANVNGHVYFIRLKPEVNKKFVLRILVSDEYRNLIRSVCVGGIDFPIICPTEDMVNKYIAFVDQVDKSKVAVKKALDETQMLFDSLMQKYFA